MSMPFVSKQQVVDYLRTNVKCSEPVIQVIDVYPAEDDIVSYGLYVHDVITTAREVTQLAIQKCGSIYNCTDEFNILFVSFQNDPQSDLVETAIQALSQNVSFFDGYTQVTYSRTEEIGNRSEKHIYTFNMQRIDFNNIAK